MDYFDEKSHQVDVDSLAAFGIPVSTRYGKAKELAEMILFANEAAIMNLHGLVKSVFYDSNSCCCNFEFTRKIELGSPENRLLLDAAQKTISQFEWLGTIYHGLPLEDD